MQQINRQSTPSGTASRSMLNYIVGDINNYLTDPDHFAREAIDAFDKANRAHRRITGRGLLQGPKL